MKVVQWEKPITPPTPIHLYNKLFYWSGDNYLSHIIKHLEQIGGSNYWLPQGYPSLFIVVPLYITWWDLLCLAFACISQCCCAGVHWQRRLVVKSTLSKSFVIRSWSVGLSCKVRLIHNATYLSLNRKNRERIHTLIKSRPVFSVKWPFVCGCNSRAAPGSPSCI